MDNDKPCQATPHGTLLEQIMDSNLPKSEREWAAARELAAKDAEIERLKDMVNKYVLDVSAISQLKDSLYEIINNERTKLASMTKERDEYAVRLQKETASSCLASCEAELSTAFKENEQNRKACEDSLEAAFEQNEVTLKENEIIRKTRSETCETIERLMQENERLREALKRLVAWDEAHPQTEDYKTELDQVIFIAKQAIEGREKG